MDGLEADLTHVAETGHVEVTRWPALLEFALLRFEQNVATAFPPMPASPKISANATTPTPPQNGAISSNDPPSSPPEASASASNPSPSATPGNEDTERNEKKSLPLRLQTQYDYIYNTLSTQFSTDAPHTVQRLAELVLLPRHHYKQLPAYLNAVDRVVSVSSGNHVFPLPSVDQNAMTLVNGSVAAPSTNGVMGDDQVGGALLTPIPWLRDQGSPSSPALSSSTQHLEGTEAAISMAETMREQGAVTQGELLRQEQENSDPPAPLGSLSSRPHAGSMYPSLKAEELDEDVNAESDELEKPHARGPEEIGSEDIGPQQRTPGLGQPLDLKAAVGRSSASPPLKDSDDVEMGGMDTQDVAMLSESHSSESGMDVADADAILAAEKREQDAAKEEEEG